MPARNLRLPIVELPAVRAEAHELLERLTVRDAAVEISRRHGWSPPVGKSTVARWADEHRQAMWKARRADPTEQAPVDDPETIEDHLDNAEGHLQMAQDLIRKGGIRRDLTERLQRIRDETTAVRRVNLEQPNGKRAVPPQA